MIYTIIETIPQEEGVIHVEISKNNPTYHRCFETEMMVYWFRNINSVRKYLTKFMSFAQMHDFDSKSTYFEFDYFVDTKEVNIIKNG